MDVIFPKVELPSVVLGAANHGWLKRFRASMRSATFSRSRTVTFLCREVSQLPEPDSGARSELALGELPKENSGTEINALELM